MVSSSTAGSSRRPSSAIIHSKAKLGATVNVGDFGSPADALRAIGLRPHTAHPGGRSSLTGNLNHDGEARVVVSPVTSPTKAKPNVPTIFSLESPVSPIHAGGASAGNFGLHVSKTGTSLRDAASSKEHAARTPSSSRHIARSNSESKSNSLPVKAAGVTRPESATKNESTAKSPKQQGGKDPVPKRSASVGRERKRPKSATSQRPISPPASLSRIKTRRPRRAKNSNADIDILGLSSGDSDYSDLSDDDNGHHPRVPRASISATNPALAREVATIHRLAREALDQPGPPSGTSTPKVPKINLAAANIGVDHGITSDNARVISTPPSTLREEKLLTAEVSRHNGDTKLIVLRPGHTLSGVKRHAAELFGLLHSSANASTNATLRQRRWWEMLMLWYVPPLFDARLVGVPGAHEFAVSDKIIDSEEKWKIVVMDYAWPAKKRRDKLILFLDRKIASRDPAVIAEGAHGLFEMSCNDSCRRVDAPEFSLPLVRALVQRGLGIAIPYCVPGSTMVTRRGDVDNENAQRLYIERGVLPDAVVECVTASAGTLWRLVDDIPAPDGGAGHPWVEAMLDAGVVEIMLIILRGKQPEPGIRGRRKKNKGEGRGSLGNAVDDNGGNYGEEDEEDEDEEEYGFEDGVGRDEDGLDAYLPSSRSEGYLGAGWRRGSRLGRDGDQDSPAGVLASGPGSPFTPFSPSGNGTAGRGSTSTGKGKEKGRRASMHHLPVQSRGLDRMRVYLLGALSSLLQRSHAARSRFFSPHPLPAEVPGLARAMGLGLKAGSGWRLLSSLAAGTPVPTGDKGSGIGDGGTGLISRVVKPVGRSVEDMAAMCMYMLLMSGPGEGTATDASSIGRSSVRRGPRGSQSHAGGGDDLPGGPLSPGPMSPTSPDASRHGGRGSMGPVGSPHPLSPRAEEDVVVFKTVNRAHAAEALAGASAAGTRAATRGLRGSTLAGGEAVAPSPLQRKAPRDLFATTGSLVLLLPLVLSANRRVKMAAAAAFSLLCKSSIGLARIAACGRAIDFFSAFALLLRETLTMLPMHLHADAASRAVAANPATKPSAGANDPISPPKHSTPAGIKGFPLPDAHSTIAANGGVPMDVIAIAECSGRALWGCTVAMLSHEALAAGSHHATATVSADAVSNIMEAMDMALAAPEELANCVSFMAATLSLLASDAKFSRALISNDGLRTLLSLMSGPWPPSVRHRAVVAVTYMASHTELEVPAGAAASSNLFVSLAEEGMKGERSRGPSESFRRKSFQDDQAESLYPGGGSGYGMGPPGGGRSDGDVDGGYGYGAGEDGGGDGHDGGGWLAQQRALRELAREYPNKGLYGTFRLELAQYGTMRPLLDSVHAFHSSHWQYMQHSQSEAEATESLEEVVAAGAMFLATARHAWPEDELAAVTNLLRRPTATRCVQLYCAAALWCFARQPVNHFLLTGVGEAPPGVVFTGAATGAIPALVDVGFQVLPALAACQRQHAAAEDLRKWTRLSDFSAAGPSAGGSASASASNGHTVGGLGLGTNRAEPVPNGWGTTISSTEQAQMIGLTEFTLGALWLLCSKKEMGGGVEGGGGGDAAWGEAATGDAPSSSHPADGADAATVTAQPPDNTALGNTGSSESLLSSHASATQLPTSLHPPPQPGIDPSLRAALDSRRREAVARLQHLLVSLLALPRRHDAWPGMLDHVRQLAVLLLIVVTKDDREGRHRAVKAGVGHCLISLQGDESAPLGIRGWSAVLFHALGADRELAALLSPTGTDMRPPMVIELMESGVPALEEIGARAAASLALVPGFDPTATGVLDALLRMAQRPTVADHVLALVTQAILNLSMAPSNQVLLAKRCLYLLLRLNKSTETSAEVKRFTSGTLFNLAQHPANRTRMYKAELSWKSHEIAVAEEMVDPLASVTPTTALIPPTLTRSTAHPHRRNSLPSRPDSATGMHRPAASLSAPMGLVADASALDVGALTGHASALSLEGLGGPDASLESILGPSGAGLGLGGGGSGSAQGGSGPSALMAQQPTVGRSSMLTLHVPGAIDWQGRRPGDPFNRDPKPFSSSSMAGAAAATGGGMSTSRGGAGRAPGSPWQGADQGTVFSTFPLDNEVSEDSDMGVGSGAGGGANATGIHIVQIAIRSLGQAKAVHKAGLLAVDGGLPTPTVGLRGFLASSAQLESLRKAAMSVRVLVQDFDPSGSTGSANGGSNGGLDGTDGHVGGGSSSPHVAAREGSSGVGGVLASGDQSNATTRGVKVPIGSSITAGGITPLFGQAWSLSAGVSMAQAGRAARGRQVDPGRGGASPVAAAHATPIETRPAWRGGGPVNASSTVGFSSSPFPSQNGPIAGGTSWGGAGATATGTLELDASATNGGGRKGRHGAGGGSKTRGAAARPTARALPNLHQVLRTPVTDLWAPIHLQPGSREPVLGHRSAPGEAGSRGDGGVGALWQPHVSGYSSCQHPSHNAAQTGSSRDGTGHAPGGTRKAPATPVAANDRDGNGASASLEDAAATEGGGEGHGNDGARQDGAAQGPSTNNTRKGRNKKVVLITDDEGSGSEDGGGSPEWGSAGEGEAASSGEPEIHSPAEGADATGGGAASPGDGPSPGDDDKGHEGGEDGADASTGAAQGTPRPKLGLAKQPRPVSAGGAASGRGAHGPRVVSPTKRPASARAVAGGRAPIWHHANSISALVDPSPRKVRKAQAKLAARSKSFSGGDAASLTSYNDGTLMVKLDPTSTRPASVVFRDKSLDRSQEVGREGGKETEGGGNKGASAGRHTDGGAHGEEDPTSPVPSKSGGKAHGSTGGKSHQLSMFEHVDGTHVCKHLFDHYQLPNGRTVHYFHRRKAIASGVDVGWSTPGIPLGLEDILQTGLPAVAMFQRASELSSDDRWLSNLKQLDLVAPPKPGRHTLPVVPHACPASGDGWDDDGVDGVFARLDAAEAKERSKLEGMAMEIAVTDDARAMLQRQKELLASPKAGGRGGVSLTPFGTSGHELGSDEEIEAMATMENEQKKDAGGRPSADWEGAALCPFHGQLQMVHLNLRLEGLEPVEVKEQAQNPKVEEHPGTHVRNPEREPMPEEPPVPKSSFAIGLSLFAPRQFTCFARTFFETAAAYHHMAEQDWRLATTRVPLLIDTLMGAGASSNNTASGGTAGANNNNSNNASSNNAGGGGALAGASNLSALKRVFVEHHRPLSHVFTFYSIFDAPCEPFRVHLPGWQQFAKDGSIPEGPESRACKRSDLDILFFKLTTPDLAPPTTGGARSSVSAGSGGTGAAASATNNNSSSVGGPGGRRSVGGSGLAGGADVGITGGIRGGPRRSVSGGPDASGGGGGLGGAGPRRSTSGAPRKLTMEQKTMGRPEFFAAVILVAMAKYGGPDKKRVGAGALASAAGSTYKKLVRGVDAMAAEALDLLMRNNVNVRIMPADSFVEPDKFRRERFYSGPVHGVIKRHTQLLEGVFASYQDGTINDVNMRPVRTMSMDGWMKLLAHARLISPATATNKPSPAAASLSTTGGTQTGLSKRDAQLCLAWSCMYTADEAGDRTLLDPPAANYFDFLEALARLSALLAPITIEELRGKLAAAGIGSGPPPGHEGAGAHSPGHHGDHHADASRHHPHGHGGHEHDSHSVSHVADHLADHVLPGMPLGRALYDYYAGHFRKHKGGKGVGVEPGGGKGGAAVRSRAERMSPDVDEQEHVDLAYQLSATLQMLFHTLRVWNNVHDDEGLLKALSGSH
eukprot:jgi/Mesvir1/23676/Mv18633-RA.1